MTDWLFYLLSAAALASGWLIFRATSAVRATLLLLGSYLAVAVLMLLLEAEFLFGVTVLVVIGEALVMVLFTVAFMLNPGGLNPLKMVHQPRLAAAAAITTFLVLAISIRSTRFPIPLLPPPPDATVALGRELLGASVLIFETAGVLLLTGMIAVVAIAARRGRFQDAVRIERREGEGGEEKEIGPAAANGER